MKLEDYLKKNYAPKTVQNYLEDIKHYLNHQGPEKAQQATYSDILDYIGHQRKRNMSTGSLNRILQAIKKYYNYLNEIEVRTDHPCKHLYLKDRQSTDIQLQDLFTEEELQLVLTRAKEKRRHKLYYRDQVIISLLIYQGLKNGELLNITTGNVDLEKGTIYISPTEKNNGRTLKLRVDQVLIFYNYLNEERRILMRENHNTFIVTSLGTCPQERAMTHVIEQYKGFFPDRELSTTKIRQSVIANKLKAGEDLRVVQAFAGHKKASTTEKYRQTDMEHFKSEIEKYHPLK